MNIVEYALGRKLSGGKGGGSGGASIPDGYIKPKGTLTIKANGKQDVSKYAKAKVSIPLPLTGELEWVDAGNGVQYTIKNGVCLISGDGEIPESLLEGNKDIKRVFIVEGFTSIGYEAFCFCTGLTAITIPDSVTNIGDDAFYGCSSLTEVNIPNSVTSIGKSVFNDCDSLSEVNIPDSVTSIGDHAFSGCTSLTSVDIPDSVTSIGDHAFSESGITTITIPNSVTSIGNHMFFGCTGLTEITIPDSVTSIGSYAFYNCGSLNTITYTGTMDQWKAVQLDSSWNYYNVPATEVICSDGTVAL